MENWKAHTWRESADCKYVDPETFFPEPRNARLAAKVKVAQEICYQCPVIRECTLDAEVMEEKFGVRGGVDMGASSKVRKKQKAISLYYANKQDPYSNLESAS